MAGRIYNKSSKPRKKNAPKPTPSTTVIGRRVKRNVKATLTKGSKPPAVTKVKKTVKPRKATVPTKKSRPATPPKKKSGLTKPKSTAKRRESLPAKRAKHRVVSTAERPVMFTLSAPTGLDVSISGSFNNWVPQAMSEGPDGLWHITLPLSPGRYQYKFVVDTVGWQDPNNPLKIANEHGGFNSVCEVL